MRKNDTRRFLSRRLLCRGEKFILYRDRLRWPGVRKVFREWAHRPRISAIVMRASGGRLVLVRQHRYGINRWLWEIPAGTVHDGESSRACARRECEEETGFRPRALEPLGFFVPTPAFSDETVFLYRAAGLKKTRANPDFDERITVGIFSEARVRAMLRSGVIQDAKSIIALYRYFGGRS